MLRETQLTLGGQEGAPKNPGEEAPRLPRHPTPQPHSLQKPRAHQECITGSDCPCGQGGGMHICQGSAGGQSHEGLGSFCLVFPERLSAWGAGQALGAPALTEQLSWHPGDSPRTPGCLPGPVPGGGSWQGLATSGGRQGRGISGWEPEEALRARPQVRKSRRGALVALCSSCCHSGSSGALLT